MNIVKIKKMTLHYFKGVKNLTVEFDGTMNTVCGPNGCGKSTIQDAFWWCLFGKNAAGRADFAVKTVDEDGEEIKNVDHMVELVLDVNGGEETFSRTLVVEYKKDGTLKGNRTEFTWNMVPMKKSEYEKKVATLVSEDVFKLITTPAAFLTMDWQKQRAMLMKMAGDVSDRDVAMAMDNGIPGGEATRFLGRLTGKTLEEYKREIQAKLTKTNDAMKNIPARIDEVKRGVPEMPDMEALKHERDILERELTAIEQQEKDDAKAINDANAERNEKVKRLNDLRFAQQQKLNEVQAKERNEIHEANQTYIKAEAEEKEIADEENLDASRCRAMDQKIGNEVNFGRRLIEDLEKKVVALRKEWMKTKAMQFDGAENLACPLYGHACKDGEACGKFAADREGTKERFLAEKKQKMADINQRGKAMAAELKSHKEALEQKLAELQQMKADYKQRSDERVARMQALELLKKEHPKRPLISSIKLEDVPECVEMGFEIAELEAQLQTMAEVKMAINTDNAVAKANIKGALNAIALKEAALPMIKAADARVTELEKELESLGMQKLQLECEKKMCDDFEVAKMNEVSGKVNALFGQSAAPEAQRTGQVAVRFQMFEHQVNGEDVPACACLCNGVRWQDANLATKVNAGMEVAAVMSRFFKTQAPIFVDNAESIEKIYQSESQCILLRFERGKRTMEVNGTNV